MYNHYEYCEAIARKLKSIQHTDTDRHFFRAIEQSELQELEQNISSAHGMIMIAIDGSFSSFQYQADSLMERPTYSVIIAKQTKSTDTDTIFQAIYDSKVAMKQVLSRIMCDARSYKYSCDMIDTSSFQLEGFGPIGDLFYGVILTFSMVEGVNFKLNSEMWL